MIKFSVVIPTYHRNDLLAKCLDRLDPNVQTLATDQYEVIVSDDGHEFTAEDMIRQNYPWVKWVAGLRKGPAANRNNGAKYAQGEWLAFTDDDCIPDAQWLAAYAESIKGTALALEGAIHPLGDLEQDFAECPVNLTGGCFWSANIAVARLLFDKVGGFDPNYPLAAHEDQDLKLRLEPITNVLFVSDAIVFHPIRFISFNNFLKQQPKRCYAFAYHARKNQNILGYKNALQLLISQYKFHLISLKQNVLTKNRCYKSILSIYMLLIGIPLILLFFIISHQTSKR
ncbi:MAG: glycosyltransferase family A protein [Pseudanabaena sp. ELA645]|jgi:GT2 family glycosyltransferase